MIRHGFWARSTSDGSVVLLDDVCADGPLLLLTMEGVHSDDARTQQLLPLSSDPQTWGGGHRRSVSECWAAAGHGGKGDRHIVSTKPAAVGMPIPHKKHAEYQTNQQTYCNIQYT